MRPREQKSPPPPGHAERSVIMQINEEPGNATVPRPTQANKQGQNRLPLQKVFNLKTLSRELRVQIMEMRKMKKDSSSPINSRALWHNIGGTYRCNRCQLFFFALKRLEEHFRKTHKTLLTWKMLKKCRISGSEPKRSRTKTECSTPSTCTTKSSQSSESVPRMPNVQGNTVNRPLHTGQNSQIGQMEIENVSDDDVIEIPIVHTCQQKKPSTSTPMGEKTTQCHTDSSKQSEVISCSSSVDIHVLNIDSQSNIKFDTKSSPNETYSDTEGCSTSTQMDIKPPVCQQPESLQKVHNSKNNWSDTSALRSSSCKGSEDPVPTMDELRLISEARTNRVNVSLTNQHFIYCNYCLDTFERRKDLKRHRFYECIVRKKRPLSPSCKQIHRAGKKQNFSDKYREVFESKEDIRLHPRIQSIDKIDADIRVQEEQTLTSHLTTSSKSFTTKLILPSKRKVKQQSSCKQNSTSEQLASNKSLSASKTSKHNQGLSAEENSPHVLSNQSSSTDEKAKSSVKKCSSTSQILYTKKSHSTGQSSKLSVALIEDQKICETSHTLKLSSTQSTAKYKTKYMVPSKVRRQNTSLSKESTSILSSKDEKSIVGNQEPSLKSVTPSKSTKHIKPPHRDENASKSTIQDQQESSHLSSIETNRPIKLKMTFNRKESKAKANAESSSSQDSHFLLSTFNKKRRSLGQSKHFTKKLTSSCSPSKLSHNNNSSYTFANYLASCDSATIKNSTKRKRSDEHENKIPTSKQKLSQVDLKTSNIEQITHSPDSKRLCPEPVSASNKPYQLETHRKVNESSEISVKKHDASAYVKKPLVKLSKKSTLSGGNKQQSRKATTVVEVANENKQVSKATEECVVECNSSLDMKETQPCGNVLMQENNQLSVNYSGRSKNMHNYANNTKELPRQDHINIKTSVCAITDTNAANVDELSRHKNNIISQLQNKTSVPKVPKSKIYSYIDSVVQQLKIPISDVNQKSTSIKDKQRVAEEPQLLPTAIGSSLTTSIEEAQEHLKIIEVPREMTGNKQSVAGEPEVLPSKIGTCLTSLIEEAEGEEQENGQPVKIIDVSGKMTLNKQRIPEDLEAVATGIASGLTSVIEESQEDGQISNQHLKINEVPGELNLNDSVVEASTKTSTKCSTDVCFDKPGKPNIINAPVGCTFSPPSWQKVTSYVDDCGIVKIGLAKHSQSISDSKVESRGKGHEQGDTILSSSSKVGVKVDVENESDSSHCLDETDGDVSSEEDIHPISVVEAKSAFNLKQARVKFSKILKKVSNESLQGDVNNPHTLSKEDSVTRESENDYTDHKDEASVEGLVIDLNARATEKHDSGSDLINLTASGEHKVCDDNPHTFSKENTLSTAVSRNYPSNSDGKASQKNVVIILDANTTKYHDTGRDMSNSKMVGDPQLAAREVSGQNVCDQTQHPDLLGVGSLTSEVHHSNKEVDCEHSVDHDRDIDQMVAAIEAATTQIKSNSSTSDFNAVQSELETAGNKSSSCISDIAAVELQPGEADLERHTEMSRRYLADTLMPFLQNLKSSIQPCSEQRISSQLPLQSSSSQVDFERMKKIHKERQEREKQKRQVSRNTTGETVTPNPVTMKCSNTSSYSHNKTSGSDVHPNGKGALSKTVSEQIMTFKCSECLQEFSNLAKMYSSQHSCRYQGHSKVIPNANTTGNHPLSSTFNSSHKRNVSVPQSGHDNRQQSHHPKSSNKRRRSSFPSISVVSKRHSNQKQKYNRIVSAVALGSANSKHHASARSREEQQDLALAISTHPQTLKASTSQRSQCNKETKHSGFQYFSALTSSSSVECPAETQEPIGLYAIPSPAPQRTVADKTNQARKSVDAQEPIGLYAIPSPAPQRTVADKTNRARKSVDTQEPIGLYAIPSPAPQRTVANKTNRPRKSVDAPEQIGLISLPSPAPHESDLNKVLSQPAPKPNGKKQNKVGNSHPTGNQLQHETSLPSPAPHESDPNKVLSQSSPAPNRNNQNKVGNSDPTENQLQHQTSLPSPAPHESDPNKVLSQSSPAPNGNNQYKVGNSDPTGNQLQHQMNVTTVVGQQPVASKDLKGPGKAIDNNKPDGIEQITEEKNKTDEADQIGGLEMTCEDESDLSLGLSINSCHLPSWINNSMSEIVASPHPPFCDAQDDTVIPTRETSPAKTPTAKMSATNLSSTSISVDDTCVISSAKESAPETSVDETSTPSPPTVISSQVTSMQPSVTVAQFQSLAGQSQTNPSSIRDCGLDDIADNAGELDIESLDPEMVLAQLSSLSCGNTQDVNDEIRNTARKIMFNIKHLNILKKKQSLLKNPKSNGSEVQTTEADSSNSSSEAIAKLGQHNEELSTAAILRNGQRSDNSLNETRAPDHHISAADSQVQSSMERILNTTGQQSAPTQSESVHGNNQLHPQMHAYHCDHGSGYEYPHMPTNSDSVNWRHPPPPYTNSYLANIVLRQTLQRQQSQQERVSLQQQVQQQDQQKTQVQCQQQQEAQIQQGQPPQQQQARRQQLQQAQIQQSQQQYNQAKIHQANLQQIQQIYHTQPALGQQQEVHRQAQQQQVAQKRELARQKQEALSRELAQQEALNRELAQQEAQRRELARQKQEAQRRELAQQQQEAQRQEFAWQQHEAQRQAQQQEARRRKLVSHQLARQQQEAQRRELARQQQKAQRRESVQQQQEAQRQAQQHQVTQRLEFEQQQQISQRKQAQQQQYKESQRLMQTEREQYMSHPYLQQSAQYPCVQSEFSQVQQGANQHDKHEHLQQIEHHQHLEVCQQQSVHRQRLRQQQHEQQPFERLQQSQQSQPQQKLQQNLHRLQQKQHQRESRQQYIVQVTHENEINLQSSSTSMHQIQNHVMQELCGNQQSVESGSIPKPVLDQLNSHQETDENTHSTPTAENSHQIIVMQAVLKQQNPGVHQSKKQRTQSSEDQCESNRQTDSTQRDISVTQTECESEYQSIVHSTQSDTQTINMSRGPSPAIEQQGQARMPLSGLAVCRLYFQQFEQKYRTTSIAAKIKSLKLRYMQLANQYETSKTTLTKYATDLLVTVLVKDIRMLALNIKYAAVEKLLQNVDLSSQEAMQLDEKKKNISKTLILDKLIKSQTEAQYAYIQSRHVEFEALLGTQIKHANSNAVVALAQKYPNLSQLLQPVSQQTTEGTSCETLERPFSAPVNIKQELREQDAPTASVKDLHVGNHTPASTFSAEEPLASGNRQTEVDEETQVAPDCRLQESLTLDRYSSESSQLNQHNELATTDIQQPNVVNGHTASNEPLFIHSTNSSSSNVPQSVDILGSTTFEQLKEPTATDIEQPDNAVSAVEDMAANDYHNLQLNDSLDPRLQDILEGKCHSGNTNSIQHNERIINNTHHLSATSENVVSNDCHSDSLCTSIIPQETSIFTYHSGKSTSIEHGEPATDVQHCAVDNMTPKESQFIVLDRTKESEHHSDNITDDALPVICKEPTVISQQIVEKNMFRHEPVGAQNKFQTEEASVGEQLSSAAALCAIRLHSIVENTLGPKPTAVRNDLQTAVAPLSEQLPCDAAPVQCVDPAAIVSQQSVNKDTLGPELQGAFNDHRTEEVPLREQQSVDVADSTKDHPDVVSVRQPDVNLLGESHKDTTDLVDVLSLYEELDSQSGLSLEKQSKSAKEHLDSAQVMPSDCNLIAQAQHPSESVPARYGVEQPTLSLSATRSDDGRYKVPEAEKSITDLQASQSVEMQCLSELSKGNQSVTETIGNKQVQVPTPEDSAAEQQDSPSEESHSSEAQANRPEDCVAEQQGSLSEKSPEVEQTPARQQHVTETVSPLLNTLQQAKHSTSPDLIDQRKTPEHVQSSHTSLQTESSWYTADLKNVPGQSCITPKRPTRPQPDITVTQPVSPVPSTTASDFLLATVAIQPALPSVSTLSRLIIPTAAASLSPVEASLSPVEVRPYRMQEKPQRKEGLSEHAKDTQMDTEGYFVDSAQCIQCDKQSISADTVRAPEVMPVEVVEKSNVQMQTGTDKLVPDFKKNTVSDVTKVFENIAEDKQTSVSGSGVVDISDSDSDIDVVSVTPAVRPIDRTSEVTGNQSGSDQLSNCLKAGPPNPIIIDVNNKVAENQIIQVSRGQSASIPSLPMVDSNCSSQTVSQTSPARQPSKVSSLPRSVLPPQTPVAQAVPDGNTRQDLSLNRQCPEIWKSNSWRTPRSVCQSSVIHPQQDSSIIKQPQQRALKADERYSTSGSTSSSLKASSWTAALFGSQTSVQKMSKNQVHDTGARQGESTVVPSSSSQPTFSDKLYPTSILQSSASAQHSLIWAPNNWCTPACAAQTSVTNTACHTSNIGSRQDIFNPAPATLVTETRPVAEVTPQSRTSPLQYRGNPQDEVLPIIISVQSLHPDVWKNKVNNKE